MRKILWLIPLAVAAIALVLVAWSAFAPVAYAQASTSSTYSPYSCQSAWSGKVGGNAQVLEFCTEASAPTLAEWCLMSTTPYGSSEGEALACWPGSAP
jgi:hypothetical protein